jgi:hypothetical protein
MNFKNLILLAYLAFVFGSCSSNGDSCNATYFGGQIVNPRQNFITLSKDDVLIDTLYLDKENNFLAQIDVEEEGLYIFKHSIEYQYVYIQPKDSLLIHLNSWDFDESLVFSGRGSEKNNFLISLYLQNEKEALLYVPYYKLPSDKFEEKFTNSLSKNNLLYKQLQESGIETTSKFDELAIAAINYPLYKLRELYSWRHKQNRNNKSDLELSESFYSYRDKIELDSKFLSSYVPYYSYVSTYLYGEAMHKTKSDDSNFIENHLNIIVENIAVEPLKNTLLYRAIYNDFRKNKKSCALDQNGLKIFVQNCTDDKYISKINSLGGDCEIISIDKSMHNFEITTIDTHKIKINSIIKNNKTVIYFWSPEIISPYMLAKRVKYLGGKFPDLLFIGINMDPSKLSERFHKKLGNQYYLTKESSAHQYVKSFEPRTILINQNGTISNSFTYLSSPYLEKQLAGL